MAALLETDEGKRAELSSTVAMGYRAYSDRIIGYLVEVDVQSTNHIGRKGSNDIALVIRPS